MLASVVLRTATLDAQVLFSTGWDNPTNTPTDQIWMNGTARGAAITGGGSDLPSPSGFWTVTNASQVDLSPVGFITNGTNSVGAASGADILRKGAVFTTGLDFASQIGATNSNIRYATTTGVWAPQFNSTAVNDGRFNVLFEIKSGFSFNNWNIAFRYGTASTSGVWDNNTAAGQNGTADVDIYSVAPDGTLTLTSLTFTGVSLLGAGPLASLNADNAATTLGAGNYLLSIALTGKTLNQRYTIDNLAVIATAIPEPSTYAMVLGGLALLVALRRMRKH